MADLGVIIIQDRLARYFLYEDAAPLAYLELVTHVYEFFKSCATAEFPDVKLKRQCYIMYESKHDFPGIADMKNLRDAYVHELPSLTSLYDYFKALKPSEFAVVCGYFCGSTDLDRIMELRARANSYLLYLRNTYSAYDESRGE